MNSWPRPIRKPRSGMGCLRSLLDLCLKSQVMPWVILDRFSLRLQWRFSLWSLWPVGRRIMGPSIRPRAPIFHWRNWVLSLPNPRSFLSDSGIVSLKERCTRLVSLLLSSLYTPVFICDALVFMWVPTLQMLLKGEALPTGLVFSAFMLCVTIGGRLFGVIHGRCTDETLGAALAALSCVSMIIPWVSNYVLEWREIRSSVNRWMTSCLIIPLAQYCLLFCCSKHASGRTNHVQLRCAGTIFEVISWASLWVLFAFLWISLWWQAQNWVILSLQPLCFSSARVSCSSQPAPIGICEHSNPKTKYKAKRISDLNTLWIFL